MAKLGDYEFPEIGLVESIELGQKIAREFAGEVSRQGLARSLGMSERGGAFSARLGALRMWGVAGGRSRVRVTRDGLRAVTPLSAKESEDARIQLARNIALFTEMSTRLGEQPYAPDRFAVLLEEISGADRTEVARRLALVDRIFSEVRPYLPKDQAVPGIEHENRASSAAPYAAPVQSKLDDNDGGFATGPTSSPPIASAAPRDMLAGDRIELGLPDGKLSLPETLSNLDAALTVLWARRQLVAANDAAEGRTMPAAPRDFLDHHNDANRMV
ncbi:MAG: hypothetical protein OSB68_08885 [Dehalococcoidia bacterium]|nr:hypothetical protein [Dehalococcoidia bacterium]